MLPITNYPDSQRKVRKTRDTMNIKKKKNKETGENSGEENFLFKKSDSQR